MTIQTEFQALRKGLLEFLILSLASARRVYVADILERLNETDFATKEGTLYPLLSRMRRDRLLRYEWQESSSGPPRKYYELTAAGETKLGEFREYWTSVSRLIEELGKKK